jgi:glycosyltransferase involved in cell wall biosynthesis
MTASAPLSARPLRLLLITYYWPPSGGAGVQRCLQFARHLPAFGIEPTVLTVDPTQAAYPVRDESLLAAVPPDLRVIQTPTTEPFGVYQKVSGAETIPYGGFANVSRTSYKQHFFKFLRGNLFVPDPRRGWNRHAVKAATELLATGEFDGFLTSSPPHSTQLIGLELKKRFPHLRWLADMRDPWTDIYYYKELRHLPPVRWLDARYERQVMQRCDALLTTSRHTGELLLSKAPETRADKLYVIPNGYDEADFEGRRSAPPTDVLRILHAGTITEAYRLDAGFLAAIATVQALFPAVPVRLRFVGQVSAGLVEQVRAAGLADILELKSYVPHDEAVNELLSASVLLLGVPDVAHNAGVLPGKLFEYLAARKPILAVGPPDSEASRILTDAGIGPVLAYTDRAGLEVRLTALATQWLTNPNLDLPSGPERLWTRRALAGRLAAALRSKAPH